MRTNLETDPRFLRLSRIIGESREVAASILRTNHNSPLGDKADEGDSSEMLSEAEVLALGKLMTEKFIHSMVLTALYRVWAACNQHAVSGIWIEASFEDIDDIAALPGFGLAMKMVGWAEETEIDGVKTIKFPNFLEHNSPIKNYRSGSLAGSEAEAHTGDPVKKSPVSTDEVREAIKKHNQRIRDAKRRALARKKELVDKGLHVPDELNFIINQTTLKINSSYEEYCMHVEQALTVLPKTTPNTHPTKTLAPVVSPKKARTTEAALELSHRTVSQNLPAAPVQAGPTREVLPTAHQPPAEAKQHLVVSKIHAPVGAFQMYVDWLPTEDIYAHLAMSGSPRELLTHEQLAAFKSYHFGNGRSLRQSQWEVRLCNWLKRGVQMGVNQNPNDNGRISGDLSDVSWMKRKLL